MVEKKNIDFVDIDDDNDNEEKTYNYLIYQGFEEDDILFLKSIYKKEGIKFCIKTFNSFSLLELKDNLNKKKAKENKNIFKKIIEKYFKC